MNNILADWKSSENTRKYLIIALVIFLIFSGFGIYLYYSHLQEQTKVKEEKERKLKQEQNSKNAITEFYTKAFEGASIVNYFSFLKESEKSRIPLLWSGFNEVQYQCNTSSCEFDYNLMPGAIFSTQKKFFFGKEYEPSFSEDNLVYSEVESNLIGNLLLDKMNNNESITAPNCSDMLNFIYSYNSSKRIKSEFININRLPVSSISSQEDSYPDYIHNYELLVGEFTVTNSNNYVEAQDFWLKKPYKDYFIITEVTKEKNNTNNLSIKGNLICKK